MRGAGDGIMLGVGGAVVIGCVLLVGVILRCRGGCLCCSRRKPVAVKSFV